MTGIMEFHIKDATNGSPLAADVNIDGVGIYPADSGGFVQIILPAGHYTFTVSASGYKPYLGGEASVNDGMIGVHNIVLLPGTAPPPPPPPGTAQAEIMVYDSRSSIPVEGASVTLNGSSADTDANGEAFIEVAPGIYILTVNKEGYNETQETIYLPEGASRWECTLVAPLPPSETPIPWAPIIMVGAVTYLIIRS